MLPPPLPTLRPSISPLRRRSILLLCILLGTLLFQILSYAGFKNILVITYLPPARFNFNTNPWTLHPTSFTAVPYAPLTFLFTAFIALLLIVGWLWALIGIIDHSRLALRVGLLASILAFLAQTFALGSIVLTLAHAIASPTYPRNYAVIPLLNSFLREILSIILTFTLLKLDAEANPLPRAPLPFTPIDTPLPPNATNIPNPTDTTPQPPHTFLLQYLTRSHPRAIYKTVTASLLALSLLLLAAGIFLVAIAPLDPDTSPYLLFYRDHIDPFYLMLALDSFIGTALFRQLYHLLMNPTAVVLPVGTFLLSCYGLAILLAALRFRRHPWARLFAFLLLCPLEAASILFTALAFTFAFMSPAGQPTWQTDTLLQHLPLALFLALASLLLFDLLTYLRWLTKPLTPVPSAYHQ